MPFQRVSVIGLGYIGLPTAAVLASRKLEVLGVDVQQTVVDTINRGEIHIVEPDLDMVVNAAVNQGFLRASQHPEPADAFLIAVPTPFGEAHQPNLQYIQDAARSVAPVLKHGDLVILESTSPVGTTEQMARWLAEARPDLSFPQDAGELSDIRIAHCPERVLPGHVLRELVQNDRIVGGMTPRCSEVAVDLYRHFVEAECLVTDVRTAEMCKLTENSFRDVNIAFANELSILCEQMDIDVWNLIRLANRHPRVNILQPGPGVGGHCIAVDPWFIVAQNPDDSRLIRTAREVNDYKPDFVVSRIREIAAERTINKVLCLGASFKPNIDDLRESPALEVATKLAHSGLEVAIIEPNIDQESKSFSKHGCRQVSIADLAAESENAVLALLVAHDQFSDNPEVAALSPLDFCGVLSRS